MAKRYHWTAGRSDLLVEKEAGRQEVRRYDVKAAPLCAVLTQQRQYKGRRHQRHDKMQSDYYFKRHGGPDS